MKRRYKLLLIIVIGMLLTIIINGTSLKSKITLVSFGDSLSLGMTPYHVAGTSFNDYLKEYFENNNKLDVFNNEFSIDHLKVHDLNEYLEENKIGFSTRIPIKQTIAKAEVITIAIGLDEFADLSLRGNISLEHINNYIGEMEEILKKIRDFYDKKIVIIGLYPAYKFSKNDAIQVNKYLSILCGKYNSEFIDILGLSLIQDYYLTKTSYYMNYQAHKKIANTIYGIYKNKI